MKTKSKPTGGRCGFRCVGPDCGQWVGDRQYVGPIGHAPQNLCFECWADHWDRVEARAVNGGSWTHLDEALWLVCQGMSMSEAGAIMAVSRRALRRWVREMRLRPELAPDWLIHMNNVRLQRRDQLG